MPAPPNEYTSLPRTETATPCEKEPFVPPPTKQPKACKISVPAPNDYAKGEALGK